MRLCVNLPVLRPHRIKKLHTYYGLIAGLVVVVTVFLAFRLQFLRFNYDFEAFFPNENHELELFTNYRNTFEYENEFVLIILENKKGIFKKDFLIRVDSLAAEFERVDNITRVTSPTRMRTVSLGALVPYNKKVLNIDDESLYAADSAAIYASGNLVGSYFPADAKSLCLFLKTADGLSKAESDKLATDLSKVLSLSKFDDVHYAGRVLAQKVYIEILQKEFLLFICLAFLIVVVFLWLTFRSLYGILVPLLVVVIAIIWTLGIMELMGKPIDLMVTLLPTMIFITGMSDVVHFFSKYFEELARGTERSAIYQLILKEVGFPTFLTLITTVVGFLSLLFSSIVPIREFGIYTSVGVSIAFLLTYTLLPALLYFFTPKKLVTVHDNSNRTYGAMRKGLSWIFRNQKTILGITALLLALSFVGISKIRINNILLEDLNENVKIKQDFMFIDEHYCGVRPFELQIKLSDPTKTIWDYEVMQQIAKVDAFIKKEYDPAFLMSPAGLVKAIYTNSQAHSGKSFPDKDEYAEIEKLLKDHRKNKDLEKLIRNDGKLARITSKIRDIGSIKINEHNKKLSEFMSRNIDPGVLKFDITGAAYLIDLNNEYMVSNMLQGFFFSIIVIGVLTFFLHRSWRMVLVFILPNLIPLLIIAGIMGFAGVELKSGTSLIFSIAFGIATDDTIHFISRLKIELGYGKSLMYAFKRTYFETGRPIILTTFILLGGFLSLTLSNFQSTFYFGFLICITIIIAVLADIFLLPVLLFIIYGKTKK